MFMRFIRSGLVLSAILFFTVVSWGETSSLQKVNTILEKWTSVHWGDDCFVWIVHYPEELIVPWVDAEAEKKGMTADEGEQYRQAFANELMAGENEVFLFSVYYFGQDSMNMSPFSGKISLRGQDGKDHIPLSYDTVLDSPVKGVSQGLVFFPKQGEGPFSLFVKGLGVTKEAEFNFPFFEDEYFQGEKTASSGRVPVTKSDVIVMPTNRPDQIVPPEMEKIEPVSFDAASEYTGSDDVQSGNTGPSATVGFTKTEVLSRFIDSWISGDYPSMYDLLSESSRRRYSRTSFIAGVMQSPFRLVLTDGYDIRWIDDTHAEVIAKANLMLVPSLKKKEFEMVETADVWNIAW